MGKLSVWVCRSQKLNTLSSLNFQLSLFLMSTKSYLKFRTIRGTPPKWVGFGKPLLGTRFLPGTEHLLLSTCALNRVHNGGKRLRENSAIKNTQHTRWSSYIQLKQTYTKLLLANKKLANNILHGLWDYYSRYAGSSKISPVWCLKPCISPWIHNGCEWRSPSGECSLQILRQYSPGTAS